jgi:hypothetical protein
LNLLLGMPLLLFLALLPVLLASTVIAVRMNVATTAGKYILRLALLVLGAAFLAHLWLAVSYLFAPGFRDHIEPNTAVIAWLFASGIDIYHPIDAAERYSFLYGPLAYMATGMSYGLFGASTFTAKLAGFVCLVLTFTGVTAAVTRAQAGRWLPVIIALGYLSLLALFFKKHSFWSKPDPFMMAATAFGLFACVINNRRLAWLLCGLCLGLAVNAKITGAVYFLPLLAWFFERDGFRAVITAGLMAAIIAVLPFVTAGNISLVNYLALLQAAGDHGISKMLLFENSLFILLAATPALSYLLFERIETGSFGTVQRHKWVSVAVLMALTLILIAASKPGSGPHHFLPFLPILAFFTAHGCMRVYAAKSGSATWRGMFWGSLLAFLVAVTIKSSFALYYGLRIVNPQVSQETLADISAIIVNYPDNNIYMGYGDGSTYVSTFYRNHLAYAGNPYLLDASAMMDFQFSGLEIPAATTDKMLADGAAVWLIPAGQEPFSIVNWYYRQQNGLLFNASFRQAFGDNFIKVESTPSFDVYTHE